MRQVPLSRGPPRSASKPEICSLCHLQHAPNRFKHERCYILCAYCHCMHLKRDLVCGRCPRMEAQAQEEQLRSALHCPDCRGEGSYEKIVETTVSETREHYERRLKGWLEAELGRGRAAEDIGSEEWPLRKILKRGSRTEDVDCKRCEGQGRILRLVECCGMDNCKVCNGDGFVLNGEWMKLRMEGVEHQHSEEPVQCSICLSSVEEGERKLAMECGHIFHPSCILKWLLIQEKCPVCRQVDPFIDSEALQQGQQGQQQGQPRGSLLLPGGRMQYRDIREFQMGRMNMERIGEQGENLWRMGMGLEREAPDDWQAGQRQEESVESQSADSEAWVSDHSFTLTENMGMEPSFNLDLRGYPQYEEDW